MDSNSDYSIINDFMVAIRRQIHEYPELGLQEFKTSDLIYAKLSEAGFQEVYRNIGKTGVVAVIRGEVNESILIRADMDALALQEETDYPFKSKVNGMHHACGHDGHVAMALGAAIYTMQQVKAGYKLKRGVKFCFQPAEETLQGALLMVEDPTYDLLEAEPRVTFCYAIHILSSLAAGMAAYATGPITARSERFQIDVEGKGGHAMQPEDTVDALQVGAQLVSAIYQIRGRNVSQTNPVCVSIGVFQSGTLPNIINANARIQGSVRTMQSTDRESIFNKLQSLCDGAAMQHGCAVKFTYLGGTQSIINSQILEEQVENLIKRVVGDANLVNQSFGMVGEDFSVFSERRPSAYMVIGGGPMEQRGQQLPNLHHSPQFFFDERCLLFGFNLWRELIFQ